MKSRARADRRTAVRGGRPSIGGAVAAAVLVLVTALAISAPGHASGRDGSLEPSGRGLQVLGGREAILLEQSDHARQAARSRALMLYRLLRTGPSTESSAVASDDSRPRLDARTIALATTALARDLAEARALRAELDRVRAQRVSLRDASEARGLGATTTEFSQSRAPLPDFLRPVAGPLVTPFGVGRDAATGAWIFRAAASIAVDPDETVHSPSDGRVVRVTTSVAGGAAVVIWQGDGHWTFVMSGLGPVEVAPGELVRRGDPLGRAPGARGSALRIETWHGRSPVDPAAVLRLRFPMSDGSASGATSR
jgi:murein DD-endopeptidase MepM/ murein hydrolase activator NlpD